MFGTRTYAGRDDGQPFGRTFASRGRFGIRRRETGDREGLFWSCKLEVRALSARSGGPSVSDEPSVRSMLSVAPVIRRLVAGTIAVILVANLVLSRRGSGLPLPTGLGGLPRRDTPPPRGGAGPRPCQYTRLTILSEPCLSAVASMSASLSLHSDFGPGESCFRPKRGNSKVRYHSGGQAFSFLSPLLPFLLQFLERANRSPLSTFTGDSIAFTEIACHAETLSPTACQ